MGGEKFDSPQPESFLFGENSGKYPPQFPFNIQYLAIFFSLTHGQRIMVAIMSEVLIFPSKFKSLFLEEDHCHELFFAVVH
jgi:hypothetical protein